MKNVTRMRMAVFALLVAAGSGFAQDDNELARLIDRAKSEPIEQQGRLNIEIAERELQSADRLYSSDQIVKARDAIRATVSYADKASDAAIKSGKHLKDTEIAMRKMSLKLRDMKRKLTFNDQTPLQDASDHLESLRTNLLTHMFNKKK